MIYDIPKIQQGMPQRPNLEAERREGNRSTVNAVPTVANTTVEAGAFYGLITISSEDATNGDIYLQGGQVVAGSGTETVANFLLYDASAETWAGSAGQHLKLTINGTGSEADDVLMPTFDLTSVSSPTAATPPIGDNTMPAIGALPGSCVVSLGVFSDGGFSPAAPGNIQASFCFGGFTASRF